MGRELPSFGAKDQALFADTQPAYVGGTDIPSCSEINESMEVIIKQEENERCGAVEGVPLYSAALFRSPLNEMRKLKR